MLKMLTKILGILHCTVLKQNGDDECTLQYTILYECFVLSQIAPIQINSSIYLEITRSVSEITVL
jgi:hypothetical protein